MGRDRPALLIVYWQSNFGSRIMRATTLVIMAVGIVVLSGCATQPESGVVGWKDGAFSERSYTPSLGSDAPDIPFTTVKGKQTTFHRVRAPITVVAFTSPPGEACCWLKPELVKLAEEFRVLPITVTQVSVPTDKCKHGAGCVEVCHIGEADLMSLCDESRKAWRAYGQPESNTVFIIDDDDKIAAMQNISNLDALAKQAEKMGEVYKERHEFDIDYAY
jgi:hypothetical protein